MMTSIPLLMFALLRLILIDACAWLGKAVA